MADKLKVEDNNEKSFVNKAADFIVKNKIAILAACAALVLAVVLIVVISSVSASSKDKAMIRIDALQDRYNSFALMSSDDVSYTSTFDGLVADLNKETGKSSYVSVKATYLLGQTYFAKGDFSTAYDYYMKAYDLNSGIYFAPVCLINAAVCKEKANDLNAALDLFKRASETEEFKVQALFNVGRIYLLQNNKDLARATFQTIADMTAESEYKALSKNIITTL